VWPWQVTGVCSLRAAEEEEERLPVSLSWLRECQGRSLREVGTSEPNWQSFLFFLSNLPPEISSCCWEGAAGVQQAVGGMGEPVLWSDTSWVETCPALCALEPWESY
jgi:hypothetical protein